MYYNLVKYVTASKYFCSCLKTIRYLNCDLGNIEFQDSHLVSCHRFPLMLKKKFQVNLVSYFQFVFQVVTDLTTSFPTSSIKELLQVTACMALYRRHNEVSPKHIRDEIVNQICNKINREGFELK